MRRVDLRVASSGDLLHVYWGFLSGGGLVLEDDLVGGALREVEEGEEVVVGVYVGGNESPELLDGRVVRRAGRAATIIRLSSGAAHARLLGAVFAGAAHELESVLSDASHGLRPIQ